MRALRIFIFLLAAVPLLSSAAVWPKVNTWNLDWEKKYSVWVSHRLYQDIFSDRDSAYYGFELNCADFLYAVRAIFAYENKLEFAMVDPAQPSGIFSSETDDFDRISDPVLRMRAFVLKVKEKGSIRTLVRDSFLIPVKDIRPGHFLLASFTRGHSWLIFKMNEFATPTLLYGSEPPRTMIFESYAFPTTHQFFENNLRADPEGLGVRAWRWPTELKTSYRNLTRAGLDQTRLEKDKFFSTIKETLSVKPESPSTELRLAVDNACVLSQARVIAVQEAYYGLKKGAVYRTAADFEHFSTVHRDKELRDAFENVDALFKKYEGRLDVLALRTYRDTVSEKINYCTIDWADNRHETIGTIRRRSLENKFSSDPNASLASRWGEE